jgi:Na+/phosphate symporter
VELLKSITLVNILWIAAAIAVIILGFYREHLYRQDSDKKQNDIIQLQKKIIALQDDNNKRQGEILTTVRNLEKRGEISPESAGKIIHVILSENISLQDSAETKLSPSKESSKKEDYKNDDPKSDKTTLKDGLEIKVLRSESQKDVNK